MATRVRVGCLPRVAFCSPCSWLGLVQRDLKLFVACWAPQTEHHANGNAIFLHFPRRCSLGSAAAGKQQGTDVDGGGRRRTTVRSLLLAWRESMVSFWLVSISMTICLTIYIVFSSFSSLIILEVRRFSLCPLALCAAGVGKCSCRSCCECSIYPQHRRCMQLTWCRKELQEGLR